MPVSLSVRSTDGDGGTGMTERIRELLDEAVADIRPRDPDPVPEVLRRGRARRRQLAAAGAAAAVVAAVLATGGVVAVHRAPPDTAPQPAVSASRERRALPPLDAEVTGGFVRTGWCCGTGRGSASRRSRRCWAARRAR